MSYREPECCITGNISYELPGTRHKLADFEEYPMSYLEPECCTAGGISYELPGTRMLHNRRYILCATWHQNATQQEVYPMSYLEPECYTTGGIYFELHSRRYTL